MYTVNEKGQRNQPAGNSVCQSTALRGASTSHRLDAKGPEPVPNGARATDCHKKGDIVKSIEHSRQIQ